MTQTRPPTNLRESIAAALASEHRYGPLASEALSRSWVALGRDRGWPDDEVRALALACAEAGIMPDTVRAVTELTGRIITVRPARKATPRKVVPAPGDSLKVSYE